MLMRITEAARLLGTSPRMLRYRESLGLLPTVRDRPAARRQAGRLREPSGQPGRAPGQPGRAPGQPGRAPGQPGRAPGHRRFGPEDLDAVALALAIEQRYDISPAALAFGLRVLADPAARSQVAELGRRIGRIQAPPARALDFEKERAHRLLSISDDRARR
ncbi:MAG: MerR family DNA-binding transcriptional regulator [Streptosporangiaceae bacterium]